MSQVTLQGNASGTGIFTIAAPNSNTNRTVNLPDAGGDVVLADATQTLTNKSISGAQINSGTVAAARLGSGTPSSSNFLRGDGSWQAVPAAAPSTAQVLTATAGASVGAVGTYAFARRTSITGTNTGDTVAGSALAYGAGTSGFAMTAYQGPQPSGSPGGSTLSGTWRCMGHAPTFSAGTIVVATLFLRIS
jgi:hypothetical protein